MHTLHAAVTIGFSNTAITVTEGSSVTTACAQVMNSQQLDRSIVFTMATADGSALVGQDYSFLNAELSFNSANDQQLLCMSVGTVDDSLVEGSENFFVDITASALQVSVNPSRLTVTIMDNDQPGTFQYLDFHCTMSCTLTLHSSLIIIFGNSCLCVTHTHTHAETHTHM